MIARVLGAAKRMPWTLTVGAIAGLAIGGAFGPAINTLYELYDEANPVATITAEVITARPDDITVRMSGTKRRACQYIRLQAYMVRPNGTLQDADIARVDVPEDGDTKPIGHFAMGVWRIWPRHDAVRAQVFAQHMCAGRLVVAKVVDVEIPR